MHKDNLQYFFYIYIFIIQYSLLLILFYFIQIKTMVLYFIHIHCIFFFKNRSMILKRNHKASNRFLKRIFQKRFGSEILQASTRFRFRFWFRSGKRTSDEASVQRRLSVRCHPHVSSQTKISSPRLITLTGQQLQREQ